MEEDAGEMLENQRDDITGKITITVQNWDTLDYEKPHGSWTSSRFELRFSNKGFSQNQSRFHRWMSGSIITHYNVIGSLLKPFGSKIRKTAKTK